MALSGLVALRFNNPGDGAGQIETEGHWRPADSQRNSNLKCLTPLAGRTAGQKCVDNLSMEMVVFRPTPD